LRFGGIWSDDQPVGVDGYLISSRHPDDVAHFIGAIRQWISDWMIGARQRAPEPSERALVKVPKTARAGARESCADFGVGVWNFKPKTGVVLSFLLDLTDSRHAAH